MAGRFRPPLPALPAGVVDFGEVVWSQPDLFVPSDPPEPADLAWVDATGSWSQQDLLAEAVEVTGRLLTGLPPTSRAGLGAFLGPLLSGAGTVWVRHGDAAGPDRLAERAAAERATPWPG